MMKTVRVPASSANLGPGFDTLGMALDIYLECAFEPCDRLTVEVSGRDAASIPADESNLIWQTVAAYGAPPIHLRIQNDIPLGKGLGSSAAAITAGIVIANELQNRNWSRDQILNEAARIEGHPDNAAACVLGGIVVSATISAGRSHAVRLALPPSVEVAVVVPDFVLPTKTARAALPECYSREDAVFNLQRAALMVAALATGSLAALSASMEDRLHQPYRAGLVPGLREILDLRAAGLIGCVLSGAGPSVLVFCERGARHVCSQVVEAFAATGQRAEILHAGVAEEGFHVSI